MKEFKWTESSNRLLTIIKKKVIKNFEDRNPQKFKINITKKKNFLVVPIPYNYPAFQLFINDKFYTSYFLKDKKWIILK